jgi:hypothetical protein
MVEIGIAEYFDIGAALGIIGTMFVVLYYSRKQAQGLSADIEVMKITFCGYYLTL